VTATLVVADGVIDCVAGMFHRVLVAVDGSPHAQRALEEAADLARVSGASLTMIAVVPNSSVWVLGGMGWGAYVPEDVVRELDEQQTREYEAMLDGALESIADSVQPEKVLAHGRPVQGILDQVRAGDHDLVVMGSRGRGEVKGLLLGSVSHSVLQLSPAPVLIVHLSEDTSAAPQPD
jgi:nucleotide-binding universal stress UspA family protein